jgi:hypothetical protein
MKRLLAFLCVSLAACGRPEVNPQLALNELPKARVRVTSQSSSAGVSVEVTVSYDTAHEFCGALKNASAKVGDAAMTVANPGERSYPVYYDGGMKCDFPTFTATVATANLGPVVISDGTTSWTVALDSLDPGELTVATTPTVHPGDKLAWHARLPPQGTSSYRFTFASAAWAEGTELPSDSSLTVPAGASGAGTLSANWTIKSQVARCEGPSACEVSVTGSAGASLTVAP